jgi:hypothetical protein
MDQQAAPSHAELSPYHASLDTPLLDFGGERWTIRDACEATCIVGAPGSGKSSASAKYLRRACLTAGMGALFGCAKVEEFEKELLPIIREAGREDDLVVMDDSGTVRFNILDYAARHLSGPGFEQNLVVLMERMSEAVRVASAKGKVDSGEGKFFTEGASKWLSHAFPLLLAAEGTIRLKDVYEFITTAPKSAEDVKTPEWRASYCSQVHLKAHAKRKQGDAYASKVMDEHGRFFLQGEFITLDNRPRSSIEATLTNLIYPFLTGKLAELFCTDTNVTPDAVREGAIIVLDLPPLKFGPMGAVAQTMFKYVFGMAMQKERVTEQTRPVLCYFDECQHFLNSSDADLLATARSAKVCPVFITQDYPTFFAKIGEDDAKSLLGKFGTRVFHSNASYETNLAAAELIGKVEKFHMGESVSTGQTTGGGGTMNDKSSGYSGQSGESSTRSQSASGYMDFEIPPDHFATKLRTGAQRNGFKVDGIVVRTGRNWKRTGRHWLPAEFDQR